MPSFAEQFTEYRATLLGSRSRTTPADVAAIIQAVLKNYAASNDITFKYPDGVATAEELVAGLSAGTITPTSLFEPVDHVFAGTQFFTLLQQAIRSWPLEKKSIDTYARASSSRVTTEAPLKFEFYPCWQFIPEGVSEDRSISYSYVGSVLGRTAFVHQLNPATNKFEYKQQSYSSGVAGSSPLVGTFRLSVRGDAAGSEVIELRPNLVVAALLHHFGGAKRIKDEIIHRSTIASLKIANVLLHPETQQLEVWCLSSSSATDGKVNYHSDSFNRILLPLDVYLKFHRTAQKHRKILFPADCWGEHEIISHTADRTSIAEVTAARRLLDWRDRTLLHPRASHAQLLSGYVRDAAAKMHAGYSVALHDPRSEVAQQLTSAANKLKALTTKLAGITIPEVEKEVIAGEVALPRIVVLNELIKSQLAVIADRHGLAWDRDRRMPALPQQLIFFFLEMVEAQCAKDRNLARYNQVCDAVFAMLRTKPELVDYLPVFKLQTDLFQGYRFIKKNAAGEIADEARRGQYAVIKNTCYRHLSDTYGNFVEQINRICIPAGATSQKLKKCFEGLRTCLFPDGLRSDWTLTATQKARQEREREETIEARTTAANALRARKLAKLVECREKLVKLHRDITADLALGAINEDAHLALIGVLQEEMAGLGLPQLTASARSSVPLLALYEMEAALHAAQRLGKHFAGEDVLFAAFQDIEVQAEEVIRRLKSQDLLTEREIAVAKSKESVELEADLAALTHRHDIVKTEFETEMAKASPNVRVIKNKQALLKQLSAKQMLISNCLFEKQGMRAQFFSLLEAYYQARGTEAHRLFKLKVTAYEQIVEEAKGAEPPSFEARRQAIANAEKTANRALLDAAFFSGSSCLMPAFIEQLNKLDLTSFARLLSTFGELEEWLPILQCYFTEGRFQPAIYAKAVSMLNLTVDAMEIVKAEAQTAAAESVTAVDESAEDATKKVAIAAEKAAEYAKFFEYTPVFDQLKKQIAACNYILALFAAEVDPGSVTVEYSDLLSSSALAASIIKGKFTDFTLLYQSSAATTSFERWLRAEEAMRVDQSRKDEIAKAYWQQKAALAAAAIEYALNNRERGYGLYSFAKLQEMASTISATPWVETAGLSEPEVVAATISPFRARMAKYAAEGNVVQCLELLQNSIIVCGVSLPDETLREEITHHMVNKLDELLAPWFNSDGSLKVFSYSLDSDKLAAIALALNGLDLPYGPISIRLVNYLLPRLQLALFAGPLNALQLYEGDNEDARARRLAELQKFTVNVITDGVARPYTFNTHKLFYSHVINQLEFDECLADPEKLRRTKNLLAPPLLLPVVTEILAAWERRREIPQALVILKTRGITTETQALYDEVKKSVSYLTPRYNEVLREIELDSVATRIVARINEQTADSLWQEDFTGLKDLTAAEVTLVFERLTTLDYSERHALREKLMVSCSILADHVDAGKKVDPLAMNCLLALYKEFCVFSDRRIFERQGLEALLELTPAQLILLARQTDNNLQPLLAALRGSAAVSELLLSALTDLRTGPIVGETDVAESNPIDLMAGHAEQAGFLLLSLSRKKRLEWTQRSISGATADEVCLETLTKRCFYMTNVVEELSAERLTNGQYLQILATRRRENSFAVVVKPLVETLTARQASQHLLDEISSLSDETAIITFLDGLSENEDWRQLATAKNQSYKDSIAQQLNFKINRIDKLSLPSLNRLRQAVLQLATAEAKADTKKHIDDMLQKFKACLLNDAVDGLDYDYLRAYSEIILGMGNSEQQLQFAQLCLLRIQQQPAGSQALLDLAVDIYGGPVGLYQFITDKTLSRERYDSASTIDPDAAYDSDDAHEAAAAAATGRERALSVAGSTDVEDSTRSVTPAQVKECILIATTVLCQIGLLKGAAEPPSESRTRANSAQFFPAKKSGDESDGVRRRIADQLAALRALTHISAEASEICAAVEPLFVEPVAPALAASA